MGDLIDSIYLWIVYEWNEPTDSEIRKKMSGLLFDLTYQQNALEKNTINEKNRTSAIYPPKDPDMWKNALRKTLKEILETVRKTNQEFPEEIKNLILMYSL